MTKEQEHTSRYFPRIEPYEIDAGDYLLHNKSSWTVSADDAALLIYDMQTWYVNRYDNPSPLMNNVGRLRKACTQAGMPVFFAAAQKVRHVAERGIAYDLWGPGICAVSDAKDEDDGFPPELTPSDSDFVVHKRKYSAFYDTNFENLLRSTNRSQLILCGVYAHHGCMVTAIEAYMRNFKVFFVGDALGDLSWEGHDMALRYVPEVCGQIALTDQVIEQIETKDAK